MCSYYHREVDCQSPFTALTKAFGNPEPQDNNFIAPKYAQRDTIMYMRHAGEEYRTITASACLTKHLNARNHELDIEQLKRKMMERKKATGTLNIFDEFLHSTWDKIIATGDERDKAALKIDLFRYAFGQRHIRITEDTSNLPETDLRSMRWSFCRDGWVNRHRVKHCFECNECFDDAWHCRSCGACNTPPEYPCRVCLGLCRHIGEDTGPNRRATRARPPSPPPRAEAAEPSARTASRKRPRASTSGAAVDAQSSAAERRLPGNMVIAVSGTPPNSEPAK